MTKIEKVDLKSKDIKLEQIQKLRALFPEVITENKIDFEKLKLTLGEEIDSSKERYGMSWAGKSNCYRIIQEPSVGTLKPAKDESIDFDTSQNIFIEGDNLEVLKLLQKSYFEKIKMIYIDPPYNTGSDFVYNDKFGQQLQDYLIFTGQVDSEGKKLSTNVDTGGRFHSNWMNMLYPRLFLAKNLLRDDGVIFISIDDHEVANLRKLCDEIFGEENYVQEIIWEKKFAPQNDASYFSLNHEQILCYAKNKAKFKRNLLPMTEEQIGRYNNPDNDPRGKWQSDNLTVATYSKNYDFPITKPDGEVINPPHGRCWRTSKEKYEELVNDNRIWFGSDGSGVPRIKRFLSEVQQGMVPISIFYNEDVGHTQEASKELKELMGNHKYFDYPKPTKLIKRLLMIGCGKSDLILDFFAGSGTTAHAVLDLNKDDCGTRKFICVQIPEPTSIDSEAYKAGYKNIAEISKERIRKAINLIEVNNNVSQKKLIDAPNEKLNFGFKVFKLDQSNFKIWDSKATSIQTALSEHVEQLEKSAKSEDILYELLLKDGFELTTSIKKIKITDKEVYSVEDNMLLICLDQNLTKDLFKEMKKLNPHRVIVLDKGFNEKDELKTNAVQSLGKNDDDEFILRTV